MDQSEACIGCHSTRRAPGFIDAAGQVNNITTHATGNFPWAGALMPPYPGGVVAGDGRQRHMNTPQRNGDCNVCHTAAGPMEAPGRITMPAP